MYSNSRFGTGTDLDYLIEMGYDDREARKALEQTKGDRVAAVMILQGVCRPSEGSAWQGEHDGDFAAGLSDKTLPQHGFSRGLWKSPMYCRVSSARTNVEGVTLYTIRSITKLGEQFDVERRYNDFYGFKKGIPLGTCTHFKNRFPLPGIIGLKSFAEIENRRSRLEEWLREFVLDENIMTTRGLLFMLYTFLDYKQGCEELMKLEKDDNASADNDSIENKSIFSMFRNRGKKIPAVAMSVNVNMSRSESPPHGSVLPPPEQPPNIISKSQRMESNPFDSDDEEIKENLTTCVTSSESSSITSAGSGSAKRSPLKYEDVEVHHLTAIPALVSVKLVTEPAFVNEFHNQLPCKASVDSNNTFDIEGSGKDDSMNQLRKDFQRDRIIIQNHRLEGSAQTLEQLIVIMKQSINRTLSYAKRPSLSLDKEFDSLNTDFCMKVLGAITRTHSAYLTHVKFSELCKQDPNDAPLAIVPESSLADPIKIRFSVKQRHSDSQSGTGEYCVVVEMEAGTVFRVSTLDDDDMKTLLQVRCTYCRTIFGMPSYSNAATGVRLKLKEGKSWILMVKEMHTTSRDWNDD
jgi:hypothetical protein